MGDESKSVETRTTPWRNIVLLCGKCSRKMDGGYGHRGKETLRTALRQSLSDQGIRREVRIIETKCLGICPKKAVVAINTARPQIILTIPAGTNVDAVATQLLHPDAP
jgi:predicted metal-binding protein